ncbi:MAG TPA: hypothetical protein VK452_04640 [Dissulfurispiraceae bacterium]|nr:hypothetical protein [Dissulfurispiraceae bacterium]
MAYCDMPEKELLTNTLRLLLDMHPIKTSRAISLTFIYMGLQERYPGLISFRELDLISKRKKTPEQIADAIMLVLQHKPAELQASH